MSDYILGYNENNGLVLCEKPETAINNAERLYISEVSKLDAYAVLFRRYYRNENETIPYKSEPAVCIFKEEHIAFNSPAHLSLHAALWSSGKNEIYIILGQTRVDIINSRKPATPKNGRLSIDESLVLASNAIQNIEAAKFSAEVFESGTFWEQSDFSNLLNEKNSPHIHLLTYLMAVRKKLLDPNQGLSLNVATIDKLLVVSILVKFLEEIKDDDEHNHTLRGIYKKLNVDSFVSAVYEGLIVKVFDELSNEFNGKIFDTFDNVEKIAIQKSSLSLLAQFLQAKIDIDTQQLFLWEQYSFKHLPAEVISAIYENFIQAEAQRTKGEKEKGVVYTPIHLVNFLVDEAMPLEKAEELFMDEVFTVLDPTCGSGVFIVAAYKRLLQWWAINNSRDGRIEYPDSETSQKILQKNIYGIDVKETAILVSIFGLTTALLDKLQPKEIWSNLKLKDLTKKNVIKDNFFEWGSKRQDSEDRFDLIIGNPPFNPESNVDKKDVLKDEFIGRINFNQSKIPRNNFALHFFEGSLTYGKKTCMILPASILLYDSSNTAFEYRRNLFTNFEVCDIYDFTHLRRDLFHGTADTPVIAIMVNNSPNTERNINHTVIKRTISSENKIQFEIDYYDQHRVPYKWANDSKKQFIWKTNLLGGGRLFHFIYRLKALPTLKEFIQTRKGWLEARGFEGKGGNEIRNCDIISSIDSNYQPFIESEKSITAKKIKDLFLYEPPFLIIDQILGSNSLLASFIPSANSFSNKSRIYFSRDFIGISAPKNDEEALKRLFESITQNHQSENLNYQLFIISISSSSLVLTETDINKSEILDIPFSDNNEALKLSFSEKIIQNDVLNYYRHLGKSISRGSAGHVLNKPASEKQIYSFAKILCSELNLVYHQKEQNWQVIKVACTESFSICLIGFGEKINSIEIPSLVSKDSIVSIFNNNTINRGAFFNRIIRYYQHVDGLDCIYLIKPKNYRYWLKSIALRDADEIFGDLQKEGF